ncbi:hypothetical protein [Halopelagius longus]|uniref:Uncharacterized protein n=1 Tax=Halopelagius longus TaxID=1236180 RepID=A0A1H0YIN1_9EURY|nr:hypothetical protein [Halopelagius longus]RDI72515.1 hypothetical protein DWB78_12740 [Halopelagius longus]SDQ15099.1 hypothetical protein SAMN05216278_0663 [Halopelagius longus]
MVSDSDGPSTEVESGLPEFSPGWAILFMLLGSLATLISLVAVGALSAEFVQSAVVPLGAFAVGVSVVWWVLETYQNR